MTEIVTVPLSKLTASEANMRKTARESGIEELAASIAAHGLLQNLTVRPVLDGESQETGKYEVVAGGRRLLALKLLAKRKTIGKASPVACALLGDANPTEVSLAEMGVLLLAHAFISFMRRRASSRSSAGVW